MITASDVQRLENYITLPDAAKVLRVSKQMIYRMVFEMHDFELSYLRAVGEKPTFLILTTAVEERRKQREIEAAANEARKAQLEALRASSMTSVVEVA